jgi:hypothetical protein
LKNLGKIYRNRKGNGRKELWKERFKVLRRWWKIYYYIFRYIIYL